MLVGIGESNAGDEKVFSGQGYGWGSLIRGDGFAEDVGLGYLPRIYWRRERGQDRHWAAEVAIHAHGRYERARWVGKGEVYRANLYGNWPQTELVIGRQQINFGPAMLLRSLRWFDALDPRDPLKIVGGVDGIRCHYTFMNNSNVWGWGLYSSEKIKGYELLPTPRGNWEWGGRWQFPLGGGEVACTGHQRPVKGLTVGTGEEYRLALDGRWDLGPGLWFEGVGQYTTKAVVLQTYRRSFFLTLGGDYTFTLGNGLYLGLEHWVGRWQGIDNRGQLERQATACLLTYPLSLLDNVSFIGFYDWQGHDFYPFMTFQRTYDRVVLNLSLYHSPAAAYATSAWHGAGTGLQLMVIYNH